jgi:FMN reductase
MPSKKHITSAAPAKSALHVLAVVGSLGGNSSTRIVIGHLAGQLKGRHCAVDVLDFRKEPLPLYNPDTAHESRVFAALQRRVERADVILLGTPDYHGSISSVMKSFLDHFWHEFAGKLFATVVASHEKGLTVTDQLRTVARQCYAWCLPYGISFMAEEDIKKGKTVSPALAKRLAMASADIAVYGRILAAQRHADLNSTEPGFMARRRPAPKLPS